MGRNAHPLGGAYNMYDISYMTFYCRGAYRMQLIPAPLQCQETMSFLIRWDLQDPLLCLQCTNCQSCYRELICATAETDSMNTSWVQAPCNIHVLQIHAGCTETWLLTNCDIGIHSKYCCSQFQTAGWCGRHLRLKYTACVVASGTGHNELLQYSQYPVRVQSNSP